MVPFSISPTYHKFRIIKKKKKKIKTSEDEGFGKFGNAIGLQDFLLESII